MKIFLGYVCKIIQFVRNANPLYLHEYLCIEYPFQVWNVINIRICWNMIKLAVCDNIGVVRAEGTVPAIELTFLFGICYMATFLTGCIYAIYKPCFPTLLFHQSYLLQTMCIAM